MNLKRQHNGLSAFLDRKKINSGHRLTDGAIVLSLDKSYRVFCRPATHGDLVLESRLMQLPQNNKEADELIAHTLLGSWVRMQSHADIPVLSQDETEICLQQRISSDATVDEFENALEQFTNSISDWRRILRVL